MGHCKDLVIDGSQKITNHSANLHYCVVVAVFFILRWWID